jgi:hypothetical protein
VGQEILDGTEYTYDYQLADAAGVSPGHIEGYRQTLALVAPALFPRLSDGRGKQLLDEFASRGDEWDAELSELGQRGLDEEEFVLFREVRAHLFHNPRVPARGPAFLATVFGCEPHEAEERFGEAWIRESERILRAAFPESDDRLAAELGQLRPRLQDPLEFEIACHLIGCALSGRQTNGAEVAREMRIPQPTVARHIAAAWAEVLDRFPELGERPRGPGRPKKRRWVGDLPPDSDLASDSDVGSD